MTLHTYATIGGYKSHYSTDGNTTLCGRDVSNATSGHDMCKTCDKRAAKLREAEVTETADPVEPTPIADAMVDANGMPTDAAWARHGELMDAMEAVFQPMVGQTRIDPVTGHRYVVKTVKHRAPRRFHGPSVTVSGEIVDSVVTPTSAGGTRTTYGSHASEIFYTVPDETPLAIPAAPDAFDMANLTDAQMTVLETNIGRVPEVIANALAAVAHGSTQAAEHRATYYTLGTTALRADVDPAAYSSAVVNANDTAREEGYTRRSAEWFDCLDYSYESMRVENESARQRAAFYAEQDAETADAAPFEPYAAHVRWAVGPVATPGQRDAKLARIEADAAAGTLPTNVAEWGWSAEELASVKATAEANAAAPEPSDVQDDGSALEAALEAAESHLSPLSRAHAPARAHADSMDAASVSNYPRVDANGHAVWACCESAIGAPCQHRTGPRELSEPMVVVEPHRANSRKVVAWLLGLNTPLRREFRADRSTPLHVAYWAQVHGVRPATGKRFDWEKHETLSLAHASF